MPFDAAPVRTLSVLYVTGRFPVLSETFVANELREMRALGHRAVPLALNPERTACQPQDEPLRDETLHLAEMPLGVAFRPAALARAMRFVRAQRGFPRASLLAAGARVAHAARRVGAEHIHAHFAHAPAAIAITAARLVGITASFTGHGFEVYGSATVDLAAKIAHADAAVAVCEDMAADFRAAAPKARVALVHCGVDVARFRRPLGLAGNGRLLAIGRLVEQKGYEVLIDALARLPHEMRPEVDAVGTGPLEHALRERARAAGVAEHLRFLGARSASWIAAEGPAYAGFVAPYVVCENGDRDTGPLSVKEAMAMELPVVCSALMGMKEMVRPGAGLQVPPGDAGALAAALQWLVTLPSDTRRAVGRKGRDIVIQDFTLRGQAIGLANLIASLKR